ncbi:MAG: hypothetical protein JO170_06075 [Verrucomicrobia bacterium]|nr:hypothetical protein [Verrucomicrobiota bacterium]
MKQSWRVFFSGAVAEGNEWSCKDITGAPQDNRGSFHITREGWCNDFQVSGSKCSVINAITSEARRKLTGITITRDEVFEAILEDTGENFFLERPQIEKPRKGRSNAAFVRDIGGALEEKEFWFSRNHRIIRLRRSIEYRINDEGIEVEGRERLGVVPVQPSEAESTLDEQVSTGYWEEREIEDADGKKKKSSSSLKTPSVTLKQGCSWLLHISSKRLCRVLTVCWM